MTKRQLAIEAGLRPQLVTDYLHHDDKPSRKSLPADRIVHVHAKDCRLGGHSPIWCALGEGSIDWKGQVRALRADGYKGWISLETHWAGPGGDKHEASMICGRNLKALVGSPQL